MDEFLQNGTRVSIESETETTFGTIQGFGFYQDTNRHTGIRYFVYLDLEFRGWVGGLFISTIVAHPDSLKGIE